MVQVLGKVRIVAIDDAPQALLSLSAKYPQYDQTPPPGPSLSLRPERCLFWSAGDEFAAAKGSQ